MEAAEAVCDVHITIQRLITKPTDVSNSTKLRQRLCDRRQTQRIKGVCSAYGLPKEDDKPERPYIPFTETGVQSKTEPATAPRQKNGTWSFGPLTTARPWPFVQHENPAVSLGRQDDPDLSYVYGGNGGE